MTRYRTGNNESDLVQGNAVYSSEGDKIGQVEEAYYGVTAGWNGLELRERGWLDAGCSCP
jgi:hypothetical protein